MAGTAMSLNARHANYQTQRIPFLNTKSRPASLCNPAMLKVMPWRSALVLLFAISLFAAPARVPQSDARLTKAFRRPESNGWIFVHLEGTPAEIGFQHGYLLASEILDAHKAVKLELTHESKDWQYFRAAAEKVLWPHVDAEYRAELEGIVEGLRAKSVSLDLWDIVAT